MQRIVIFYVLPSLAIVLLAIATLVLIRYNFSNKVIANLLTGIFVGTATTFVTIIVGLKPTVIEKAFVTSIVMDEVQHQPVGVDNARTSTEQRLRWMGMLGYPMRNDKEGNSILTIQLPRNEKETLSYCAELIQYSILQAIRETQRNSNALAGNAEGNNWFVDASLHRPILPPKKQKYESKDVEALASNRFSNSDFQDKLWEVLPLILPKGTRVGLEHLPSSPEKGVETFKIIIEKPQYFIIEFKIQPTMYPAQGTRLREFNVPEEMIKNTRPFFFIVEVKATLPAMTAENPLRGEYQKWIEWTLNEVEKSLT